MPTYSRYYPAGWRNKPDTSTAITAEALDHFDDAFVDLQGQVNAGFAVPTVANKTALNALANTVLIAFTSDTRITWTRDTIGGPWRRNSVRFTVPEDWSDPANPTKLTDLIQTVIYAYTGYQQTSRTSVQGTDTIVGLPTLQHGLGLELYFPDSQEWHFGPPTHPFTETALFPKRMYVPLLPGVSVTGDSSGTRFVWHGTAACAFVGTPFRNYSEHATREDGTTTQTSPWSNSSSDQAAVRGGGTGQAATGGTASISWRLNQTPRSVITSNYPRATGMTTIVNVDDVWGRDKPWWDGTGTGIHGRKTITTAIAIPAALTANKWKVGDWAAWPQGGNPNDMHERRFICFAQLIAINGVTTPGYSAPTEGAGTFTLGAPVVEPVTIASEFWEFPNNAAGGYAYLPAGSGGVENVESHALFKIDMNRWAHRPQVSNIDFIVDAAATKWPTSCIQLAAATDGKVVNCRTHNPGVQLVDVNGCTGTTTIHSPVVLGANSAGTTGRNGGMVFDVTSTRNVHVYDMDIRGRLGPVLQVESFARAVVHNGSINDTNPAAATKSPFIGIGEAQIDFEGELSWIGAGAALVNRGASDDTQVRIQFRDALRVVATDPAAAPRIGLSDVAPSATVDYDGWNTAGTARARWKLDPAYRPHHPTVVRCIASSTQTEEIPPGAIRQAWARWPASMVGTTSIVFRNGITPDVSVVGTSCTHVTGGATSSDGSDDGTDADRTWPSSTNEYPAATTAGDSVLAVGANPDGTDFVTTVKTFTDTGHIIVNDLPGKAIASGTVVWIGQPVVPGKWTRLTTAVSRLRCDTTKFNFTGGKLEGEAAGNLSTIVAVFGGTVPDPTDDIEFRFELFPVANAPETQLPTTGTKPSIAGAFDKTNNPVLVSVLDAGRRRGQWRDQTTDAGAALSGPQYAIRTSDSAAVNNSTTFVVSTVLLVALVANATYKFRAFIQYDCDAAADLKMGWTVPTGASGKWSPNGYQNGVAAAATAATISRGQFDIGTGAVVGGIGAGSIITASPEGYVTTDATHSGNLAFRYAQSTAQANDLFIRAGSWLEVTRIA